jgi:hypothetical protein
MKNTASCARSQIVGTSGRPAWSFGSVRHTAILAALLLSALHPALGQQIPALTVLPPDLAASNLNLAERRAVLVGERSALHGKIDSLNVRCAAVVEGSAADAACLKEQAELLPALNAHIQKSNDFNAAVQAAKDEIAGCRPGYVEIGQQKTADKVRVYCSRVSCDQMSSRVQQDIVAQTTLRYSMDENNADLKEWAKENEAAQREALKHATNLLLNTLLEFAAEGADQKIAKLQNELSRRGREGETIATKLEKARTFEREYARWSGISDGLKFGLTPGMNAADTWVELQNWAVKAGKQQTALVSAWQALSSDPEVGKIIREESLDLAFDVLNKGLNKVLSEPLDMAKFLVNYGYDAAQWQASRLQILQRGDQADKNLVAECKLDRLMKIDVRNMNVCQGKLPPPNAADPEEQRCGSE